ncbi:hypothetical protein [Megamonas funiformis]|uniref:hypothetical protein n=1 Tax=Megamonas funiformis TaxID=437897 RepID=UPI0040251504
MKVEMFSDEIMNIAENFSDNLDKIAPLSGSPKQVEWANKIRAKVTRNLIMYYAFNSKKGMYFIEMDEEVIKKTECFILSKNKASFWIENREKDYLQFKRLIENTLYFEEPKEKSVIDEAKAEATIFPQQQKTKVVAEIIFDDEIHEVKVKSEKDQIIINTVKSLHYDWSGKVWYRETVPYKKDVADRMAEVGNKLLLAGVPIIIWDEAIRQKAINGEYEKECFRWMIKDKDMISIVWEFRSDELYRKAKRLPHAKWENGGMDVPARYYAEIRDFAKINEFKITSPAEKLLSEAEEEEKTHKKTSIKEANMKIEQNTELEDILNSSREVLEDLKDD